MTTTQFGYAGRSVNVLSEGWTFHKGSCEAAWKVDIDDSSWERVKVPHDWAIRGPFDPEIDKQEVLIVQNQEKVPSIKTGRTGALPHIGEGWYRNVFLLPQFDRGKKALILFEGAMSEPVVYVNGTLVGRWNYGYSYFHFDISDYLRPGEPNTLAVHLTNREQSSRWYPGAGLYRKVQIIVKEQTSIDQWGVTITTPEVSTDAALVGIKTAVSGGEFRLVTSILDPGGRQVASSESSGAGTRLVEQHIRVTDPRLWSPESPSLYKAVSRLYAGDVMKDEVSTTFGIRTIEYRPHAGFLLNGELRKFKGVCLHHDLGPLGAAVNRAAIRRQLAILRDMGCNAVRSAHNMPSIEQLELCDEMGIMFLAESFDEWAKPKVRNGYHRFFETDAGRDIVNLVRATRNHPCIVMWSSGNEVPDQRSSEGVEHARWLQDTFHREDPTRPVTVGMDQVEPTMKNGFGAVMDIPGLNYHVHLYEEAYARFPQGLILGSETASTVSSRGIYKFPVVPAKGKQYPDNQCSSYDLECCPWSNPPDEDFILQDDKPWVIGEFVWTGFDYLGEPTPYDSRWPARSSYFGICDLGGLPKDRYYLYRSRWNTADETLHVLPHWNWEGREGQTTPVFVYTSHDSAELFINGRSKGIRRKDKSTPQNRYRLMWMDVEYEPGTLMVVAFDAKGRPVASREVHTAGEPHQLVLEADRSTVAADGEDLAFVTVSVTDKEGHACPTAANQLEFTVTGDGTYKAACNGDPTSLEMFHEPTMRLFSGKLVVVMQSSEVAGAMELTVRGDKLKPATIRIKTSRGNSPE